MNISLTNSNATKSLKCFVTNSIYSQNLFYLIRLHYTDLFFIYSIQIYHFIRNIIFKIIHK